MVPTVPRDGSKRAVSGPSSIIANKTLLQAHANGALLVQSATQLFSDFVFLWWVPIILTTSNWDYCTMKEHEKDWLETSCVAFHIGSRVWESASSPDGIPSTPTGGSKRKWHSNKGRSQCRPGRAEKSPGNCGVIWATNLVGQVTVAFTFSNLGSKFSHRPSAGPASPI